MAKRKLDNELLAVLTPMMNEIFSSAGVHSHTIAAYPLKDGGFRGVVLHRATKERHQSEVLPTLEHARWWAKNEIHQKLKDKGYKLAPLPKKGEYQANVWTHSE